MSGVARERTEVDMIQASLTATTKAVEGVRISVTFSTNTQLLDIGFYP